MNRRRGPSTVRTAGGNSHREVLLAAESNQLEYPGD